jgi:hypothetical protein
MNVDDGKKSRAVLKSYFVKNAIPTEQQFVQLMDSMLNERDDGLVKVAGDPLAIEAAGDDTSFKKALNFYTKLSDNDPAWTLSLRPRSVPADPQTGRAGLSINDAGGNSRLAVDAATGRVGIGVVAPAEILEVAGRIKVGALTIGAPDVNTNYSYVGAGSSSDLVTNYALAIGISGTEVSRTVLNGKDIRFRINNTDRVTVTANGNVGIGTQTPNEPLEVNGRIRAGAAAIGAWPANPSQYVFFGATNLDQTQGGNYALLQGSSAADNGTTYLNSPLSVHLRIGNVSHLTVAQSGNIGIGTTAPSERLEVAGNVKTGALLLGPWPTNGNYVCFGTSTLDQRQQGNYALLQSIGGGDFGTTYLNSPTSIQFRLGNTNRFALDGAGVTVFVPFKTQQAHTVKIGFPSPNGVYGNDGIRGEPNLWLDSAGTVFIKQGFVARGLDIAERFPAHEPLGAGDVVIFDEADRRIHLCERAADRRAVGIVSAEAAFILGDDAAEVPVALCGRVPCKVDADIAPVMTGDLLTTSPTPGHAQKAFDLADSAGAIIGKALTSLASGRGDILVLVQSR